MILFGYIYIVIYMFDIEPYNIYNGNIVRDTLQKSQTYFYFSEIHRLK